MNVGIIGCGAMGVMHAAMATNCGFTVVACADTRKAKAQSLAKKYRAAAVDASALIKRGDVDVVAICTPTPSHAAYAIAAAKAGKHIFCEKPFTRTEDEGKRALDAAAKAGVKLFVGHVVRYFQEFEAMRAQVEAGSIGKVGFAKTFRGGIYPKGEGLWYRDYKQSGGVTLDCIIHDFDWLRYMFGDVKRVFCQALQRSKPDVLDYSLVTLRMSSGLIAYVTGSWAHPSGFRVKAELCGSDGMITYDSAEAPIECMMRHGAGRGPGMIVPASPVPVSPYQLEWEDFQAWLETGRKPRVTGQDALEALRIALAALESAKRGQPVSL